MSTKRKKVKKNSKDCACAPSFKKLLVNSEAFKNFLFQINIKGISFKKE
jgi:hypothetical protein